MTAPLRAFPMRSARTPPFLLLGALTFWGWQIGMLPVGLALGVVLESPRFLKIRWDLTEEDFHRFWNFCALFSAGLGLYFFTTNPDGGGISGLRQDNAMQASHYVGTATTLLMRWLPVTFFPFIAAQMFSVGQTIPLRAISWIVRQRHQGGETSPPTMNVSYIYFIIVVFSAGNRNNDGTHTYFWGQVVLIAWAFWPLRSPRFGPAIWAGSILAAIALGFGADRGLGLVQKFIEGYDAQWFARFTRHNTDPLQSRTALGEIGQLKLSGRIVIRLEPKSHQIAPDYLREASYNLYYSPTRTWAGNGAAAPFSPIQSDPLHLASWTLLRRPPAPYNITIASYLNGRSDQTGEPEGLLPLPSGVTHLDQLPVFLVNTNKLGAVQAQGPGLVVFDAQYAPGVSFDSPPGSNNPPALQAPTANLAASAATSGPIRPKALADLPTALRDPRQASRGAPLRPTHFEIPEDLVVPSDEVPALQQVIAEMNLGPLDQSQKLAAVARFFRSKFTYSTWLGPDKLATTNETALARFLLHSRSGHCEYFATATVLLLRQMGIPARYAVGYAVHEQSGKGYVVRDRDAHAWCLVWNPARQSWDDFDTTPGSWIATEGARAPWWQSLSDLWSFIRFQIAKLRWGQTNLRQYILYALGPILGLLLLQIIFQRGRKRARLKPAIAPQTIPLPGADSEFYLLEKELAARAVPRQPGEPLSAWLTRILADPALAPLRQPIQSLLPLHYTHRFDPRGLPAEDRASLSRLAKECLNRLNPNR